VIRQLLFPSAHSTRKKPLGVGLTRIVFLGGWLVGASSMFACAFPANVKEASQHQLQLLEQVDQAALNYERTFAAVVDNVSEHYEDAQAKAPALKLSESFASENRPLHALSEQVRETMEGARQSSETTTGKSGLANMKEGNTQNIEDYRKYLGVCVEIQRVLDAYISTDVAPNEEDLESLKSALKSAAQ
jgi:exonuclease VII large subunit